MADHQHCINCLEEAVGSYSYPCQQCGWSPDQYTEAGLYLSPGTILNSQYQIARMLGHGGFGITYLAWDNLLQRRLAIKEYMPRDFATRNSANTTISVFAGEAGENFAYGLERFLDEARTLAKFQQHAGIVSVLNVFYANSTGYMVMEYVDGRTLKDYLTEQGPLTWDQTLHLFMPVMDALREVHKNGVMHRDISPDNIYLCHDKRIKLLDFGAARNALGGHSHSLSVVVKPGYAPEEQYRAKGKQGPWTDVYSVAASMYRCVTGVVPPDALDRLDEDELVAPSTLGVQIPQKAEAALLSALAIKANERTQSIEAFQQALWDQANRNEPSINKANTQKKAVPPQAIKEEPTTIELRNERSKLNGFFINISMRYPFAKRLKKIKLKWYVGLVVGTFVLIFVNSSGWRDLKNGFFYDDIKKAKEFYQVGDHVKAFEEFHKSAENGSSEAQRWIGFMYKEGLGVVKDYDQALMWYRKSAGQGDPMGQLWLANMYKEGLGVNQDLKIAFDLYNNSAEQGIEIAQRWLGYFYQKGLGVDQNYQLAFEWYLKAAEQGDARGQTSLAELYQKGLGVPQNSQQAFKWYQSAADQGYSPAQNNLGYLYQEGQGVTQNYQLAFNWYKKAADQGDSYGQNFLGAMYEHGRGVEQNQAEAVKWYRLAAEQGNADAISALQRLGVK